VTPPTLTDEQLAGALRLRDLSDPASGPHAMQLIVAAITDACKGEWRCPVHTYRASRIVTVAENYEVLGYPPDAPARQARYTRYLDDGRLLRTHTSAMIPQALRRLGSGSPGAELAVACPGLVYRRDVVDRLHVGEPHQLDLWRVRPDSLSGRRARRDGRHGRLGRDTRTACAGRGRARPGDLVGTRARNRARPRGDASERDGGYPPTAFLRPPCRRVHLVLRHPTRTRTAGEANQIRDQIYAALHQGHAHQWASR
jgi:tRNA synthetases class II core domain (F)